MSYMFDIVLGNLHEKITVGFLFTSDEHGTEWAIDWKRVSRACKFIEADEGFIVSHLKAMTSRKPTFEEAYNMHIQLNNLIKLSNPRPHSDVKDRQNFLQLFQKEPKK